MQSDIEQKVMASVGAIYLARRLTSAAALRLYALGAAFITVVSTVSVPNIFSNVLHAGVSGFPAFALSAVEHTTLLVQLGLAAGCIIALSFFGGVLREMRGLDRTA